MKPCPIELKFFLKISHSQFFNLNGGTIHWGL